MGSRAALVLITMLILSSSSHAKALVTNQRRFSRTFLPRKATPSISLVGTVRMSNLDSIQPVSTQTLALKRLNPPFDDNLYNFYRDNYSHKRFVPSLPKINDKDNVVYVLRSNKHSLAAAVWLSRSKACKDAVFVRSLCVEKTLRHEGLALTLMERAFDDFGYFMYYCFASEELAPLYHRAGFLSWEENEPKWMLDKYKSLALRWNNKNPHSKLVLFVKKLPLRIVLLQHANEASRPTATAPLLLLDNENGCINGTVDANGSVLLRNHLSVQRWTWSGRDDNDMIENQINRLESPVLLWTGGNQNVSNCGPDENQATPTYVVLDGTWQEARSMYRKMPFLWNLPRLSLNTEQPSIFRLRSDYTGWRQRFGGVEQQHLLCTAEVVAALLERTGNNSAGRVVRTRLDKFQQDYNRNRNHCNTLKLESTGRHQQPSHHNSPGFGRH